MIRSYLLSIGLCISVVTGCLAYIMRDGPDTLISGWLFVPFMAFMMPAAWAYDLADSHIGLFFFWIPVAAIFGWMLVRNGTRTALRRLIGFLVLSTFIINLIVVVILGEGLNLGQ